MGAFINQSRCIGCGQCADICPGNLIRFHESGKAFLRHVEDCWGCVSCMKECPAGAIVLTLPPEMEGRGGTLTIHREGKQTEWTVNRRNGEREVLITNTDEANQY